jgi:pimeloyl-ACP methyl ester carboxylesterase
MLKNFQYFNTNISYRIEGEGEPIVLVHGFGEDSQVWKSQVEYLKDKFMVIVPDIPGSGKSSMLEGLSQAVTLGDYAVCIQALLLHEKIDQCFIFGHSMGGYITLAFVELYPNFVKGFGLIHSSAYADSEEKKQNRQRGIEMMEEYGAHAFLQKTIPDLFSSAFKKEHPAVIEQFISDARQFSKEACQQYYTAMMRRPDRQLTLKNSKVPVLLVAGTEDVAAPLNDILEQAKLPSISYIHVLDGVGHLGMMEAPGKINQYLDAFVSQLVATDAA